VEIIVKDIPVEKFTDINRMTMERLINAGIQLVYGAKAKVEFTTDKDPTAQNVTISGKLVGGDVVAIHSRKFGP
jgi:hypothetical protein